MHGLIERLEHHLEDDRMTLNPTKWAAFRDDFTHLLHAIETHFSDGHGPAVSVPTSAPTDTTDQADGPADHGTPGDNTGPVEGGSQ